MQKIRLGLIGCGGMMRAHARGIQEVEGVEITAVCDIERERAEKVAEVLNSPYVTTDYTTMVDHVDAVLVVLSHHLHYTCGLFFARHKKHIMMEKPLCNTEEECLRLIKVCEDEGVVLMCAYPVRYWTGIVKLKELMDSGEYGKPVSGTHMGTNLGTPWMLREGTCAVTIKFESGAIGCHGATWGARATMLHKDFQIQMEKGMLQYQHRDGEIRLYDQETIHQPDVEAGGQRYRVLWKRDEGLGGKQTQLELIHFLDCVRTGKKPLTDGYSSLQGLRVIWELYNAEKNGFVADLRDCALPE